MKPRSWLLPAGLACLLAVFIVLRRLESGYEPLNHPVQAPLPQIIFSNPQQPMGGPATSRAMPSLPSPAPSPAVAPQTQPTPWTASLRTPPPSAAPAVPLEDQLFKSCQAGMTIDRLIALQPGSIMVSRVLACEALARNTPQPCKLLSGHGKGLEESCAGLYEDYARWTVFAQGGPHFLAECTQIGAPYSDDPQGGCKVLGDFFARFSAAHGVVNKKFLEKTQAAVMSYIREGDRKKVDIRGLLKIAVCDEDKSDKPCEDKRALVLAIPSKNPALCGDSAVCKAFLGSSPDACEGTFHDAVDLYCRQSADNEENGRLAQEKSFRKANGLAPYKKGDRFLNELPSAERMKYEKHPRGRSQQAATPPANP